MTGGKLFELAATGIIALAASYAGAYFAFVRNRTREQEKVLDARVEACNRAIFILSEQFRILSNYQEQFIEPHRRSANRHIEMSAVHLDSTGLFLDSSSLSFLLEGPAREVPSLLAIENSRFHTAVNGINLRSTMHLERFQPALDSLVREGKVLPRTTTSELTLLLPLQSLALRRTTDEIVRSVDEAIASLGRAGETVPPLFRQALKVKGRLAGFSIGNVPQTAPQTDRKEEG